jgi:hypothetical protein
VAELDGTWRYERAHLGNTTITLQTLRPDGTYETHMTYARGSGEQHIFHYGTYQAAEGVLRLTFESGKTERLGHADEGMNFELRDFTPEEIDEAQSFLAQDISYALQDDQLRTTVETPVGTMEVVYARSESQPPLEPAS